MASEAVKTSRDWLRTPRTSALAWWIPHAALAAGLVAPVPLRAAIWTISLIWMGTACLLNAKRCGRTHCRYTGPYYLIMVGSVLALGFGIVSLNMLGWIVLGLLIVGGSKAIWWGTERAWGRFS